MLGAVLGRYMSNLGSIQYEAINKMFRYLCGTKDNMLSQRCTNSLDVIDYHDINYKDYVDNKKSTTKCTFITVGHISCWNVKKAIYMYLLNAI